jgi:putative hydrolase of the HAD superfamily
VSANATHDDWHSQPESASLFAVRAALFDLDGVVRHHAPSSDALTELAFGPESLVHAAVVGGCSWEEWRDSLAATAGAEAAGAFFDLAAVAVDDDVLAVVRALRARGVVVALVSNATSRLAAELDHHGLTREFDHVFNSSELGVAKPDPRVFELVCERMGVAPADCFFVDDRPENVAAATALGLDAHLFTGAPHLLSVTNLS